MTGPQPFHAIAPPLLFLTTLLLSACEDSPSSPHEPGTLQILISTTGASLDADGYVVLIHGESGEAVGITDTTSTRDLPPKPDGYTVSVRDVAPNCTVVGPNPRQIVVEAGGAARTTFLVDCTYVPREILFLRGGDIFGIDAGDSYPVRVTVSGAAAPTWSPDGLRIAFGEAGDVRIADPDGTDLGLIPGLRDDPVTSVAWSPDGARLMYTAESGDGWCPQDNVWIVSADGSGRESFAPGRGTGWSPDGTMVAVSRPSSVDPCSPTDILVLPVDGSADPTPLAESTAWDGGAVWSPDGERIAFVSDREGDDNIYVVNADGSDVVRLTADPAPDGYPAWSPDGTRIVFTSSRDGNADVFVMDADGSNVLKLTNDPAWDSHPTWRPTPPGS